MRPTSLIPITRSWWPSPPIRCCPDVKLIAEPWDVGYGGWQTGRFPAGWVDWNDHFRDAVRTFWLADRAAIDAGGQGGSVARLADALSGSAGLFEPSGPVQARLRSTSSRPTTASPWRDLVSYDRKHNEANGEQNRDGHGDNRSYNHGFEGPTEDEDILARRAQSSRNLMASLMISLGVPMITAGDEIGRTQQGNNNAYCQDNPITWIDWTSTPESHAMLRSHQARDPAAQGIPRRPAARLSDPRKPGLLPLVRRDAASRCPGTAGRIRGTAWSSSCSAPTTAQVVGLVVVNGGAEDVKITLPRLSNEDGTGHRLFELRLTTSELNDLRQGVRVSSGERDVVQANTINIYRTYPVHAARIHAMGKSAKLAGLHRPAGRAAGPGHGGRRPVRRPGPDGGAAAPARAAPVRPAGSARPRRSAGVANPSQLAEVKASELPAEARRTLALIAKGGPYPVCPGRRQLRQLRTHPAEEILRLLQGIHGQRRPGEPDRGARRIVAGKSGEKYYTADHYSSFKFIIEGK